MTRPGLRSLNNQAPTGRQPVRYLSSQGDLMLDLQQLIYSSCHGECMSEQELTEIYVGGHAEALTTARVAHIVSCPTCLDAVNELLGLPQLAERYRNGQWTAQNCLAARVAAARGGVAH